MSDIPQRTTLDLLRELGCSRVVLWGYRRPKHTHHWIQAALHRAFEHLLPPGVPLSWLENGDAFDADVFDGALVIGNLNVDHVDFAMPLHPRAQYIVHNHDPTKLDGERYRLLVEGGRAVFFTVFRGNVRDASYAQVAGEPCHRDSLSHANAVITWATDLLPAEIERNMTWVEAHPGPRGRDSVVFVGSVWRTNEPEVRALARYCTRRNLRFEQYGGYVHQAFRAPDDPRVVFHAKWISREENLRLVRDAFLAPALQGAGQLANPRELGNYVPCRIFKNVSYGALGVTNNPTAAGLFGAEVICSDCIDDMMDAAMGVAESPGATEHILAGMDRIRRNHTYLNRIRTLLDFAVRHRQHVRGPGALGYWTKRRLALENRTRALYARAVSAGFAGRSDEGESSGRSSATSR